MEAATDFILKGLRLGKGETNNYQLLPLNNRKDKHLNNPNFNTKSKRISTDNTEWSINDPSSDPYESASIKDRFDISETYLNDDQAEEENKRPSQIFGYEESSSSSDDSINIETGLTKDSIMLDDYSTQVHQPPAQPPTNVQKYCADFKACAQIYNQFKSQIHNIDTNITLLMNTVGDANLKRAKLQRIYYDFGLTHYNELMSTEEQSKLRELRNDTKVWISTIMRQLVAADEWIAGIFDQRLRKRLVQKRNIKRQKYRQASMESKSKETTAKKKQIWHLRFFFPTPKRDNPIVSQTTEDDRHGISQNKGKKKMEDYFQARLNDSRNRYFLILGQLRQDNKDTCDKYTQFIASNYKLCKYNNLSLGFHKMLTIF